MTDNPHIPETETPTPVAGEADDSLLARVVDAAPNAIVAVDAQGRIALVNSQTETLFGYRRAELLGRTVEMLVPPRFRRAHAIFRGGFSNRPSVRPMGGGRDLYGLRKDGTEVPVEIGLNYLQRDDGLWVLASVIDISARKRAELVLQRERASHMRQSIVDSAPLCMIATDINGTITTVNPAAERLLGHTADELIGQPYPILHQPAELKERLGAPGQRPTPYFSRLVADEGGFVGEEREWTYLRHDRSTVPVNLTITPIRDADGRLSGYLAVAYDVTERKRSEALIRHMAQHDALTDLPNRNLLLDRLDMAIRQAHRRGNSLAVLMLDLDLFKRINDSLGHQAGDKLLLAVAQRLQACVREVDTVARLGGDEFVVVVTDVGSQEDVTSVLDDILRNVGAPVPLAGETVQTTPSIGACLYPRDGEDAATLLKHADAAMYQAKAAGRNNVQWFAPTILRHAHEKLGLISALRKAVESEKLSIFYQPEVSLRTSHVLGMEALLRWRGSEVPPQSFVAVAEESGLIRTLGEWVLGRACRDCVELQGRLGRPLRVAVNVSPRQISQKGWIDTVATALDKSGLAPECLELEVTEGLLMLDPEQGIATLRRLRDLGVAVVLDDFGTGYSSLAYLTRFPIDKLKIDRGFVRNLTTDSARAAIVDAIIAMAYSLRIRATAEGIETLAQQRYLQERGCHEGQGFLYSEAVAKEAFADVVDAIESRLAPA